MLRAMPAAPPTRNAPSAPNSGETLELLRGVMFRAAPLSPEERDAFVLYSAQLRRHLDAVEEALKSAGKSTGSAQALRYLLEALPGITV
jgi:hypothetical protein